MFYPVCGMVHINETLLLFGKSSPCSGGSGFPFSLSLYSTAYNRKYKVLSASLNKTFHFPAKHNKEINLVLYKKCKSLNLVYVQNKLLQRLVWYQQAIPFKSLIEKFYLSRQTRRLTPFLLIFVRISIY